MVRGIHSGRWDVAMHREPDASEDGHKATLHKALERTTAVNVVASTIGSSSVGGDRWNGVDAGKGCRIGADSGSNNGGG